MVSEKDVMNALSQCYDPELGINLVDMGFIYGVEIKGGKVKIRMTFTTPGCPMVKMMLGEVEKKVKEVEGVKEVEVEIVWEPRWTPERLSKEARKKLGFER
ncbi:aromatic ring hydroxylase [Candidatus Micrarchaeota archaeon]|nr:MAG: aromatic ring hydroxylase [Candidatus Micrarchaeota archaeon]